MPKTLPPLLHVSAFFIIFSALFYLRMAPSLGDKVDFTFDSALCYRITENVVKDGVVPVTDTLSTYPQGRNIRAFLPTPLFYTCAYFHKIINKIWPVPLERSILFFCAFWGALICIPLYFLSYEIYRNKTVAYLTAFLAGVIPAYLHRSLCYWYRFETMAAPILFLSLLFFVKAVNAPEHKRAYWDTFIFALFMILGLAVWRMSGVFLAAYLVALIYLCISSPLFFKKKPVVIFAVLGMLLLLPWLVPGSTMKTPEFGPLALPKAIMQIVLQSFGITQNFADYTRLLYSTSELRQAGFWDMFGPKHLALAGIFAAFFIFSYFRSKKAEPQKDILFIFLILFLILTAVFLRMKIMAGPLAALTLGEAFGFGLSHKKGGIKVIVLCITVIIFIQTAYAGWRLALTRSEGKRLSPELQSAINMINEVAPKEGGILTDWSDGYMIQAYCARPTNTDGLLESPENVKRIIELGRIYYGDSFEKLLAFCKKYGITYILVSNTNLKAYAEYAGVKFEEYYPAGGVSEKARNTILYQLINHSQNLPNFKLVYMNQKYVLYKVEPS